MHYILIELGGKGKTDLGANRVIAVTVCFQYLSLVEISVMTFLDKGRRQTTRKSSFPDSILPRKIGQKFLVVLSYFRVFNSHFF